MQRPKLFTLELSRMGSNLMKEKWKSYQRFFHQSVFIKVRSGKLHLIHVASVTRKNRQLSKKKFPKNDFTRKMIDFDTYTKIA